MIIDTHCHVYKSEMENAEEIIRQAAGENIHLIVNGTDPASNLEVLELAEKYDNIHAALGYLYDFADEVTEEDISILDSQLANENVVAVGEIGLDYYISRENREKQIELFEMMLELAGKHGLPVIVHCRKAMQDAFDILERHGVVGSMHCYQGSAEMAERFVKLGFHIGIAGPITHPNNRKTRRTVKTISLNNMLVETDSPYLPPEEKRGEANTPFNLKYIIREMAEELDMAEDDVIKITAGNARELFGI
jgi:TatD DNase family protein